MCGARAFLSYGSGGSVNAIGVLLRELGSGAYSKKRAEIDGLGARGDLRGAPRSLGAWPGVRCRAGAGDRAAGETPRSSAAARLFPAIELRGPMFSDALRLCHRLDEAA